MSNEYSHGNKVGSSINKKQADELIKIFDRKYADGNKNLLKCECSTHPGG